MKQLLKTRLNSASFFLFIASVAVTAIVFMRLAYELQLLTGAFEYLQSNATNKIFPFKYVIKDTSSTLSDHANGASVFNILSFYYRKEKTKYNLRQTCGLSFDCVLTNDGYKDFMPWERYSAIMVFGRPGLSRLQDHLRAKRLVDRNPEQIWIANGRESSISRLDFDDKSAFKNYFNWSIALSPKSTIATKFTFVSRRKHPITFPEIKRKFEKLKKDKSFCWIVSQCHVYNDRFKLASEIINLLPDKIHIWGTAVKHCMQNVNKNQIIDHGKISRVKQPFSEVDILKKCKFYFSFENSNCSDYVTEKYSNALLGYSVPIVNGWRETYEQIIPHSFIHVNKFKLNNPNNHISQLAAYLEYLLKNETAYFEYFKWRKLYDVSGLNSNFENKNAANCKVCEKLKKTYEEKVRENFKVEIINDLGRTFASMQNCTP